MYIEICDSWYFKKVYACPEKVGCMQRNRKASRIFMVDKETPSNYGSLILSIVEKFGVFEGEHYWRGWSRGSRMLPPGPRERKHEVYRVDDELFNDVISFMLSYRFRTAPSRFLSSFYDEVDRMLKQDISCEEFVRWFNEAKRRFMERLSLRAVEKHLR